MVDLLERTVFRFPLLYTVKNNLQGCNVCDRINHDCSKLASLCFVLNSCSRRNRTTAKGDTGRFGSNLLRNLSQPA